MTVSIKKIEDLLNNIRACDEWLLEHGRKRELVWLAATGGVMESRKNYTEQLKKHGIVDEVV